MTGFDMGEFPMLRVPDSRWPGYQARNTSNVEENNTSIADEIINGLRNDPAFKSEGALAVA
jgi:hypothetical protein